VSRNDYSEINLHVTWHTKLSRPLLTPTIDRLERINAEETPLPKA
jgi:hypothetical protein